MSIFNRIDRHDRLMTSMADRLGVDFAKALDCGKIGPQGLRNAHFSCMNCREYDACAEWLDENVFRPDRAPDYCRNKELFVRLTG